jgi:hypothetical protein
VDGGGSHQSPPGGLHRVEHRLGEGPD